MYFVRRAPQPHITLPPACLDFRLTPRTLLQPVCMAQSRASSSPFPAAPQPITSTSLMSRGCKSSGQKRMNGDASGSTSQRHIGVALGNLSSHRPCSWRALRRRGRRARLTRREASRLEAAEELDSDVGFLLRWSPTPHPSPFSSSVPP